MSVKQAQAEIDSDEFTHWIAFERLSPNINERIAVHFGHLIWRMIAMVSKKPGKLKDHILDLDSGRKRAERSDVVDKFKAMQAMFPKKFKGKAKK